MKDARLRLSLIFGECLRISIEHWLKEGEVLAINKKWVSCREQP